MSDPTPAESGPTQAESGPTQAVTVAVLGATGFVGRAAAGELRGRGAQVRTVATPRLRWPYGRPDELRALPSGACQDVVDDLAEQLAGVRAVVNAAGLPDGNAVAGPALYGANALLPVLVARACAAAGVERYVHVSSAVVQGGGPLDETARTAPFSPYSHAKALGERLLLAEPPADRVLFRATWVHDVGKPQTRTLVRLARSPMACVAGDGTAPTPQVLVGDVAASITDLASTRDTVPAIVMQPPNGMTTALLLRLLGDREPRRVPHRLARTAVRGLRAYGRLGRHAHAHARRAELLLFGRSQVGGWLAGRGAAPALRPESWRRLGSMDPAAGRTLRCGSE